MNKSLFAALNSDWKLARLFKSPKLKRGLKCLVSLLLIGYLLRLLDFDHVKTLSWDVLIFLGASVCMSLLFINAMALRWKIMINSQADTKNEHFALYRFYLVGGFFNVFLPGAIGGDVMRINYSHKKYSLGLKKAAFIVFAERAAGIIALGLIFGAALLFGVSHIAIPFQWSVPFLLPVYLAAAVLGMRLFTKKVLNLSYRSAAAVLLLSAIGQINDIAAAYLFSRYYHLDVGFADFMLIMPLVFIATVLPISLGGLGVREGTFVSLLALFSVQRSVAVMISLLLYLTKVIIGLIGLPFYLRSK